jgi:hypothetical protein
MRMPALPTYLPCGVNSKRSAPTVAERFRVNSLRSYAHIRTTLERIRIKRVKRYAIPNAAYKVTVSRMNTWNLM